MKTFLTAIVLLFIIKGITYILFPKFIQNTAQRLMTTSHTQLVLFGWILVLVFTCVWLGIVRHLPE